MANGRTAEQDIPLVARVSRCRLRVWGLFGETHLGQRSCSRVEGRTHDRTRSVSQTIQNPLRSRGRPHMQQGQWRGQTWRIGRPGGNHGLHPNLVRGPTAATHPPNTSGVREMLSRYRSITWCIWPSPATVALPYMCHCHMFSPCTRSWKPRSSRGEPTRC